MEQSLYLPLPIKRDSEIRLLTISPDTDEVSQVCCSLMKAELAKKPQFSALSYIWGDSTRLAPIYIDGVQVNVTQNLESALRCLRSHALQCKLWIDAICINQSDFKERNAQVQIMRDIFRLAEQVYLWLGPEDEESERAMTLIAVAEVFVTGNRKTRRTRKLMKKLSKEHPTWKPAFDALIDLCARPVWKRTWILQEVVLGSNVKLLCGRFAESIDSLKVAYTLYTNSFTIDRPLRCSLLDGNIPILDQSVKCAIQILKEHSGVQALREHEDQTHSLERERSLLEVVKRYVHLDATDPRDKIYGFLGLTVNQSDLIEVDYSRSINEIYHDFAHSEILRTGSLEVVRHAGVGWSSDGKLILPTWVADWRASLWDRKGYPMESDTYQASLSLRPQIAFTLDKKVLEAGGILADTITFCQREGPKLTTDIKWKRLIFDGRGIMYPTGIPRLQAFFRTEILDLATPISIGNRFFNIAAVFLEGLGQERTEPRPEDRRRAWRENLSFLFPVVWECKIDKDDKVHQDCADGGELNWREPDTFSPYRFIPFFQKWAKICSDDLGYLTRNLRVKVQLPQGATMTKSVSELDVSELQSLEEALTRQQETRVNMEGPIQVLRSIIQWKRCLDSAWTGSSLSAILELFLGPADLPTSMLWPEPYAEWEFHGSAYTATRADATENKSYFATAKGYMGIGPQKTRRGDLICVFPGCQVPLLLRKVDEHYVLVGECFVLGLMEGEAVANGKVGTFNIH
jgi:hypothetical protein